MGKKTKNADAAQAEATTTNEIANEQPVEAQATTSTEEPPTEPEPPKPKKGAKKKAKVGSVATLADLAAAYLAHMEEAEKSDGTISSYRMELKVAGAELGEDTPLADITPEKVQAFFTSKRVTKLRSGKNKAKPSVDKTRRVLRLALVWAEERGIVAKAPLPETANA